MTAVSTFDYADRPTSLTVQRTGEPDLPIASGATYEPAGPLSHLDLGNGLTETRPYTDRYFPSAISVDPTAPLAGSPVLQWTYGTDNVGNILTIADALTPANDKAYAYQDHQYFLTGGTGPWGTLAWTYDQIGNRLTETRDAVTDTYAYTSNGSGNTALLSTITLGLGGTRAYTYGPAGHLEQVNAPGNAVTLLSDIAGRLTRLERPAGDARSDFLYDGRSFMRWAEASSYSSLFTDGFETGDGSCWTLAEGSDINAGTATCSRGPQLDSVYSSEGLLHAVTHRPLSGSPTSRYYLYLAGRPVAQLDVDGTTATATWLTTEHLGTPVLATDAAGSVLWEGGFEPFGADYSGASLAGVDLRFPGQWVDGVWTDAGEGVVNNLYRWYPTTTGRFLRPDPVGLEAGPNLYTFGRSTPLMLRDGLGLTATVVNCPAHLVGDIQTAVEKAKASARSCLPCDRWNVRSFTEKANSLTVDCLAPGRLPKGAEDCGYADVLHGRRIGLTAAGIVGICGCIEGVVFHEILHLIGGNHDLAGTRFYDEEFCIGCEILSKNMAEELELERSGRAGT